jgi:membrane-associated phospholipid phosphatase
MSADPSRVERLRSRAERPLPDWLTPAFRPLRMSVWLLAGFVVLTTLTMGPLRDLDLAIDHGWGLHDTHGTALSHLVRELDHVGQRVQGLKLLAAVAILASVWRRTVRPVGLALFAMLAVNAMVGTLKLTLGRGAPYHDQPGFFHGGDMFPSGHTANVVSIYGVCAYLVIRFLYDSRWLRRAFATVLTVLVALQFSTSILLRWHWFTDLVGGVIIGSLAVTLTVALDRAVASRSDRRRRLERPPAHAPAEETRRSVSPGPA